MKHEKRLFKIENLRATQSTSSNGAKLEGYAAKFNQLSEDLGGFREKIAPGAFAKALGSNDICAFWCHEDDQVLGRTSAKTLQLAEDDFGLRFSIDVPDTQCGRDAVTLISRGDITGMSFGFEPPLDTWDRASDGTAIRTLLEIPLFEISPTPLPAYSQTSVSARSLESLKKMQEEWAWEQHLKTGVKVEEKRKLFEQKLIRRKYFGRKLFVV